MMLTMWVGWLDVSKTYLDFDLTWHLGGRAQWVGEYVCDTLFPKKLEL
jgi:hypothetical protein